MTPKDDFKAMAFGPGKQLAAQDPTAYLDHIDATNAPEPQDDREPWERCGCPACQSTKDLLYGPACSVCEDGGTIMQAVGPLDEFGVPDGTVETPCPACAAGDAEAAYRIGQLSDSSSAAQGLSSALPSSLEARPDSPPGVSGSLVRGGDPDPSLNPRKAA